MKVLNRLNEYMQNHRDLNITELAKTLGVSREVFYAWKNNEYQPRMDKRLRLVELLNVEYNDMFYIDDTIEIEDLP